MPIAQKLLPLDPDRHTFFIAELRHLADRLDERRAEVVQSLPEGIEIMDPQYDAAILAIDQLAEARECTMAAVQFATGMVRKIDERGELGLDEKMLARRFEGED